MKGAGPRRVPRRSAGAASTRWWFRSQDDRVESGAGGAPQCPDYLPPHRACIRPTGWVVPENFRLEILPVPSPGPNEVLVRNHYLSLDPYMRGRMNEGKSYAKPQEIGATMIGATVGEVVASNHPRFPVGSHVRGMLGWTEFDVVDGKALERIDTQPDPDIRLSRRRRHAGHDGLVRIPQSPRAEGRASTLVVSAASGAVGSVVGQLAKLGGLRADRDRRRPREMPLRHRGIGIRRLRRLSRGEGCQGTREGLADGGSERRRCAFRKRRRRRAQCGLGISESVSHALRSAG